MVLGDNPLGWSELIDWAQPIAQPVLPIEYRYLLPSMVFEDDPLGWSELIDWAQPTYQPVLPTEYRYYLPNFFTWMPPTGITEGFLTLVRPRSITMFMPRRTLKPEMREGGREAT